MTLDFGLDSDATTSDSKNSEIAEQADSGPSANPTRECPRETLRDRLREAGVDTERFVDLREGTKRSYTDHTQPENQHELASLKGNYGLMAGKGMVALDIDEWSAVPSWVEDLPETLAVTSPHADTPEGHYLYLVEGDVGNTGRDWGNVQAKDVYVVGPGSELTECKYGCCTSDMPGEYVIRHDRPIASVSADTFPVGDESDSPDDIDPSLGTEAASDELDFTDIEASFDVQKRWEKAMDCSYGDKLTALWEGRFREADYGDDRSAAETALAAYLAWWMDNDKQVVAALMNRANARKWANRGDSYRQSVIDTACDHTRTFDEATNWPTLYGDDRPEVSGPTWERVYDALLELGAATVTEVVEHPRVDRSERQVRRALDQLEEDELADWMRDGRQVVYYATLYKGHLDELM